MKKLLALGAAGFLLSACAALSTSNKTITNTPVPSLQTSASFDAIDVDQKAHRLYAADRTDSGVDVFDVSRPEAHYVKTIPIPSAPNGLAVAPDLGRVFVGLSDGTVGFIDTTADKLVTQVPTGGKSVDLIDYSADRKQVFASNGSEGTVAVIDVQKATKVASFNLGRFTLEQPRYNPADHLLYVVSPDADAIFPVDPDTGAVKQKILLGACRGHGMAIDPRQSQAVVACGTWVIRMNLHKPTDATGFTQVAGGDIVSYDAKADRFFVASPSTKPSEVGIFGGNPIDYIATVATDGSGNSATYDETHNMVYTVDTRQGSAGVSAFELPTGEITLGDIPPGAFAGLAGLLILIVWLMFRVGRLADPVHRPAPQPAPARRPSASRREQNDGEIRAGAKRWTRKVEPPA